MSGRRDRRQRRRGGIARQRRVAGAGSAVGAFLAFGSVVTVVTAGQAGPGSTAPPVSTAALPETTAPLVVSVTSVAPAESVARPDG